MPEAIEAPSARAPLPTAAVAHRHVLYISGFDPRGDRHYLELLAREAAAWAQRGGHSLEIGRRRRIAGAGRAIDLARGGDAASARPSVRTTLEILPYDDVIRAHWARSPLAIAREVLRSTARLLLTEQWWAMRRTSWPIAMTVMGPAMSVLGALLGGVLAAGLLALLLAGSSVGFVPAPIIAVMLGIAVAVAILVPAERRTNAMWIARIVAFTQDQALGRTPDLEARLDQFAERITALARTGAADEILLVGHSIGSQLAVIALARALPGLTEAERKRISLLTLGQTLPLLGFCPGAERFRGELGNVASDEQLAWVDASAPPDPACFPLTDPLGAMGLTRPPGIRIRPKLVNPRFHVLFEPQSYRRTKRDWHTMHFSYLTAPDNPPALGVAGRSPPDTFDLYDMLTGPARLADRTAPLPAVSGYARFRSARP